MHGQRSLYRFIKNGRDPHGASGIGRSYSGKRERRDPRTVEYGRRNDQNGSLDGPVWIVRSRGWYSQPTDSFSTLLHSNEKIVFIWPKRRNRTGSDEIIDVKLKTALTPPAFLHQSSTSLHHGD
jgi:hypothetical protein